MCSGKSGDVAILCSSMVISTYLKSHYFRNYFSEVSKLSLLYGEHIIVFVTESLRFYKKYLSRFYKAYLGEQVNKI